MQQEARTILSEFSETTRQPTPQRGAWAFMKRVTKPMRIQSLAWQLERAHKRFERGEGIRLNSLKDLM